MKKYEKLLIISAMIMIIGEMFCHKNIYAENVSYKGLKKEIKEYKPMSYFMNQMKAEDAVPLDPHEPAFEEETLEIYQKMKLDEEVFYGLENRLKVYDFRSEKQKALIKKIENREKEIEDSLLNGLDLNLLITYVYINNPALRSFKEKWKAALQEYPQTIYLDNILKQYNAFTRVLDIRSGEQKQKEFMTKKFPLPGVFTLKGNIVKTSTDIAAIEYEKTLNDLITDARVSYYNYIFISRATEIIIENQSLLKSIHDVAEAKYSAGNGSFSNVIKVQVEISKLDDDLITLKEKLEVEKARLNTLMNRELEAPLRIPAETEEYKLSVPIDKLYKLTEENQQMLRIIDQKIQKMVLMLDMGERMFFPEVTLGASYFEERSGILKSSVSPRLMMMPQYYWFGKNDAYLDELKTRINSMKEMYTAERNKYILNTKSLYFNLDSAEREMTLYKASLIPKSETALKAATAGYEGGEVDFLHIIDAQRLYLKFKLGYFEARNKYRIKLAELEKNVGIPISE